MPITIPVYLQTSTKAITLSMNWYRNAHYQTINKVKKQMHEIIIAQLSDQVFDGPIQLHYTYFYKNKATDLMNFGALASKWLLDTLQENGNISKDTVAVVKLEIFEVGTHDKDNPRIDVIIQPYITS